MIKVQTTKAMADVLKIPREKTLVACIGIDTEKAPRYAVFVRRGTIGLYYSVTLESKYGEIDKEWLDSRELVNKVKEMVETAKNLCDDEAEDEPSETENERSEAECNEAEAEDEYNEEDEEDEPTYYCNNPDCPERGLVTEPLMEEDGTLVCPSCGMPLDQEEVEGEIEYDRLFEMIQILLTYIAQDYIDFSPEEFFVEMENLGFLEGELSTLCEGIDFDELGMVE